MKVLKPFLTASIFLSLAIYFSCRKINHENTSETLVEQKFFRVPNTTNPLVKTIANKIYKQNEQFHFVSDLVRRIGYPYWNKAIVVSSGSNTHIQAKTSGDNATLAYIPYVNEEKDIVDATLIVKVTEDDTTFKLLHDWEYYKYGFDTTSSGWSARSIFHIFSTFENSIFYRTNFQITDSRLLSNSDSMAIEQLDEVFDSVDVIYSLKNAVINENELQSPIEICDEYETCIQRGPCPQNNSYQSIIPTCCLYLLEWSVCTTIFIEIGGEETPPPPNGPPSGGSPGPWWPPPCYSGSSLLPCPNNGPGWQPLPEGESQQIDPIDSFLARSSRLANLYSDSLMTISNQDTAEYFFAIVDFNNNVLDTMYMHTDGSGVEVNPNWGVYGGRRLLGGWHSHFNNEDGSPGSGPTGADVAQLWRVKNIQNFILFIECSNKRFALVIENPQKLNQWFTTTGNGPVVLANRFNKMVNSDTRIWTSEFQNLTIEKLLVMLGNTSNCGLGLYESSNSERTTFTKLN